jgi:hypothetical protein
MGKVVERTVLRLIVPRLQFRRVKYPYNFLFKPMKGREMLLAFLLLEVSNGTLP